MYTVRLKLPKTLPDEAIFCLAEAFVDVALASSTLREGNKHTGAWFIEWIVAEKPDAQDLTARLALQAAAHNLVDVNVKPADLSIEETPDINWLEKCYHAFPPFSVGPFFIYGSHYSDEPPQGQIPLQIDAATAFGSGEHETTRGCLQAMLDLKGMGVCPWNTLDMGTGSGILAIAAWKLWKSPVLAVDNDEESVHVTERHARMNGVKLGKGCMVCACGDGFATPEVERIKPYELILANILAGPVIEMAPELCRVLDDNGYCVLSGMLVEQADLVASAYEGEGLTLKKRYDMSEWTTLVMHKGQ
ncbi:MAG: 50S ribosomal protein L11 methyltransferase [Alphaproteobacteria bacterium]|nr:50S ribosomal protein L11 methyltransferase [Alphaproteobacteria bacterium]